MAEWTLETRAGLSPPLHARVVELQRACEIADSSDLKVEVSTEERSDAPDTLLALRNGDIVGYCGVDAGADAEICGMVHPDARRAGIGTDLLVAALDLALSRGRASALVICEDAFPPALEWLERRGARLESAEHRMVAALDADTPGGPVATLRRADLDDAPALIDILSDGFPNAADFVKATLESQRASASEQTLVAVDGDTVIGTARVVLTPRRPMVYGFVIKRSLRRHGLGGDMLRAVFDHLRAGGATEVGLEVDTTNAAALHLYTRFGFRTVTTYRYVRIAT